MLEEPIKNKTQDQIRKIENQLHHPLSRAIQILVYLKHRKDGGLTTVADDAKKVVDIGLDTIKRDIGIMKKLNTVKNVPDGVKKEIIITPKGERLIFKPIQLIFHRQEKLVRKIFFHQKLTRNDLIAHDIIVILEKYNEFLTETHTEFFKSWFVKQFGEYYQFEEWFNRFSREYLQFSKQDLDLFIEKKLKKIGQKKKKK